MPPSGFLISCARLRISSLLACAWSIRRSSRSWRACCLQRQQLDDDFARALGLGHDHMHRQGLALLAKQHRVVAQRGKRVVHVELDRVRGHAEARDFVHLQLDVGVEHVVGEHAALGQEGAVLVQVLQRLVQAVADGRHQLVFFRRQVVQVLGGGFARDGSCFPRRPDPPSAGPQKPR
jgi:hypothetical protein